METKPFYRTSEFWLTMVVNVVTMASQVGGALPPKYSVPVLAITNAAYAIARGIAKAGVAPTS